VGKPVVEINPDETCVSQLCTWRLPVSATVALEAIWWRYRQIRGDQ
jgi:hypothetical protein